MLYKTDTDRVEIMFPAGVLLSITLSGVGHFRDEAQKPMTDEYRALVAAHLEFYFECLNEAEKAFLEPVEKLTSDKVGNITRRVRRLVAKHIDDVFAEKANLPKMMAVLVSFTNKLIEDDILHIPEGSIYWQLLSRMLAAMNKDNPGFEKQVESAIKQAEKLFIKMQKDGYYV
jgi:hypothetical protein